MKIVIREANNVRIGTAEVDADRAPRAVDMFDERLLEILQTMSTGAIMQIPGVYEIVAEELNNEVLESLEQDRACEEPDYVLVTPVAAHGFVPRDED